MNEHLKVSAWGIALITQFEGKPRLKARLCEGGAWELSYGVTFYPDGRPVRRGATCTHEEALLMFAHALEVFENVVKRWVKVELTQNQFDALVSLAYAIGEDQFITTTVLKRINHTVNGVPSPRWMDAACAFNLWVFATREASQREDDEPVEWYTGPDGQPCAYKRALRGLNRRHLAEGCLFMACDWEKATADDVVELNVRPGVDRVWNAKGYWEDQVPLVGGKTEFPEVYEVARLCALPPLPSNTPAPKPAPAGKPAASSRPPLAGVPPPRAPGPRPQNVGHLNVNQIQLGQAMPVKTMEESDRAIGFAIKVMGVVLKVGAQLSYIPLNVAGYYFEFFSDPFLSATIISGISYGLGWCLVRVGNWKRRKHLHTATTLLT